MPTYHRRVVIAVLSAVANITGLFLPVTGSILSFAKINDLSDHLYR